MAVSLSRFQGAEDPQEAEVDLPEEAHREMDQDHPEDERKRKRNDTGISVEMTSMPLEVQEVEELHHPPAAALTKS